MKLKSYLNEHGIYPRTFIRSLPCGARNLAHNFVVRSNWRIQSARGIDIRDVPLSVSGLDPSIAIPSSNSGNRSLKRVIASLGIATSDSIVDIGCGKGGAMITFAEFPFSAIDGIELSPEIARICEKNLSHKGISNSKVIVGDAREFIDLDRYTHIYMFNPFPCPIMKKVMPNIEASIEKSQSSNPYLLQSGLRGRSSALV